jgi:hypothetical protein
LVGEDFFDLQGVDGGLFGGVEVELALFLGEEIAFESETLLFNAKEVQAMGNASEDIDVGSVWMVGEVEAGVGELDFYVLKKCLGMVGEEVLKFGLGEFLRVATTAFQFVKATQGVEVNAKAEAIRRRLRATFLDIAIGHARCNRIEEFVALVGCESIEHTIGTHFHKSRVFRVEGRVWEDESRPVSEGRRRRVPGNFFLLSTSVYQRGQSVDRSGREDRKAPRRTGAVRQAAQSARTTGPGDV